MKKTRNWKLVVTKEAIFDFASSSIENRLRWLDDMRAFLSKTLPLRTKKIYDEFRRKGGK